MCKSCVHKVQSLLKKLSAVHKLCAGQWITCRAAVLNHRFNHSLPHHPATAFSTVKTTFFNLLSAQLCPQSTVPIIRTNK